ncbi:MAG: LON peptidase substrate-binding domain-containing protein, partial [Betaproteobacteria bacterium]
LGGDRFRVIERTVEANGLIRAEVDLIDPDQDSAMADAHRPCSDLLRRVIDDVKAQSQRAADNDEEVKVPFEPPYRLDSSVWVGNRLCEVLPVPLKAKQKLMELDDAYTRLEIITQYLKQHAVLK